MIGYRREDLGGGRVRFAITPGVTGGDSWLPWAAAIVFGLAALSILPTVLAWLVAIGGGWYVFKRAKQWVEEKVRAGIPVTATASAEGLDVAGPLSYTVPWADIRELVWRDWSGGSGNAATSCALYIDTKEESRIITTGLDAQTVARLADELARAMGGVPVVGAGQEDGLSARDAAKAKLEELRKKHAQDIVTSDMQPLQPGDLVLAETEPGTYEIQEVTDTGRRLHMAVPLTDLMEIFAFAQNNAGGRNLWFTKLSDPGPAVLMAKASA